MFRIKYLGALLVPALAALALAAPAGAATSAVTPYTVKAVTAVSDRPDGGNHDAATPGKDQTWADDYVTRSAQVHLSKEVPLSFCGGKTNTGHCYQWSGSVSDSGRFVVNPTVAGVTEVGSNSFSPGNGGLNGGKPAVLGYNLQGTMTGGAKYGFYSSYKTVRASSVPKTENDAAVVPTGAKTTGLWLTQFFSPGAEFWSHSGAASPSSLLLSGGWTYTAALGADKPCPNVASRWIDASPDWGTSAADGNVLAPAANAC